jgi:hypothetical protein
MEDWKSFITRVIEIQSKSSKVEFKNVNRDIYAEKDALTEADFIQDADSGDILLFSS